MLYKIPCADCPWSDIGETAWKVFFNEEKGTHSKCQKLIRKIGSNIAAYSWRNNYSIEFNNTRVIDQGIFRIAVIGVEPAVKHSFV